MGTQQIFMIVLSVIVVGTSVAVGVQMFETNANSMARNAVIADITLIAAYAQMWYRMDTIQGGGGNATSIPSDRVTEIALYYDDRAQDGVIENANGVYTLTLTGALELTITGRASVQGSVIMSRAVVRLEQGPEGITMIRNLNVS